MATKIDCIWVLLFTKQKKCSERIIAQVNFTWIFKFTKKKTTVGRGLSFFLPWVWVNGVDTRSGQAVRESFDVASWSVGDNPVMPRVWNRNTLTDRRLFYAVAFLEADRGRA